MPALLSLACSDDDDPAIDALPTDAAPSDAAGPREGGPDRDAGGDVLPGGDWGGEVGGDGPFDTPTDALGDAPSDLAPDSPVVVALGRWTTGDLHVHTIQSNDAQTPQSLLAGVLEAAFTRHQLDWIALSNHLRVSDRDPAGELLMGGPLPFSRALALHEVPAVAALQGAGSFAGKTIFSSVEWDMPTHDHVNVGIIGTDPAGVARAVAALNQFEYLFTNRDAALFDPADVGRWGSTRRFSTHEDAVAAIAWLEAHFPDTSYALINHPNRYPDRTPIAHLRELHDLAPRVVFAVEGLVGNQMEPDRGGYASPYLEANAHARTYGGVDSIVAKLGGVWDALLGEGRRIWNVGNSDYHFKTAQGQFSSGYTPGEYTKNHVWVEGDGLAALLAGLRSGRAFSVTGDLVTALQVTATTPAGARATLGEELRVPAGTSVTLRVRWRSDLPSRYENPVGSGTVPGVRPAVDHIDLIVGDVGPRAAPGTPAYAAGTNPTTRVLTRLPASAAATDPDGYKVLTYTTAVTKDQYFRLRGTNLGPDVPGETAGGEPLADAKVDHADPQTRWNAINDRNYADLWFYANPIFVNVE